MEYKSREKEGERETPPTSSKSYWLGAPSQLEAAVGKIAYVLQVESNPPTHESLTVFRRPFQPCTQFEFLSMRIIGHSL